MAEGITLIPRRDPVLVDQRVIQRSRMAEILNQLFRKAYLSRGTIIEEPTVFAFDTYDVTLHTYMSRLRRRYLDDPHTSALIEDRSGMIHVEMKDLAKMKLPVASCGVS